MLKLRHSTLMVISGAIWFAVGCYLLPLGINLLVGISEQTQTQMPLLGTFSAYLGGVT